MRQHCGCAVEMNYVVNGCVDRRQRMGKYVVEKVATTDTVEILQKKLTRERDKIANTNLI